MHNSIAMFCLKTLHPGGIRTWAFCIHAVKETQHLDSKHEDEEKNLNPAADVAY
jgi:hypothetical protein